MATEKFEDAIKALEEIVSQLEEGQLDLDESLRLFERGVGLVRQCTRQLDAAERKIELLLEENGDVILKSAPELDVDDETAIDATTPDVRDATA